MGEPLRPSSVQYFYGRITRDEAEDILRTNGCKEGQYLLRESMNVPGNYALSICFQGKVHHYSIERQPDGTVMIQEGKKFKGPIELVNHHKKQLDGFLVKPAIPCDRPSGITPQAWPGVSTFELEQILQEKAQLKGLKGGQLENVLGPQRAQFVSIVAKDLHRDQPWFHIRIERQEADQIMNRSGHEDGKFLVRERDDKSYALSLSFQRETKHYKIEKHRTPHNSTEKLAIEDGPRFDCLMDMIAHYHNKTDGLLCKLTMPCVRRNFEKKSKAVWKMDVNDAYNFLPADQGSNAASPRATQVSTGPALSPRALNVSVMSEMWAEPEDADMGPPRNSTSNLPPSEFIDDDPQSVYDSVPRTEDVFNLNKHDLELFDKLGAGNFGSVIRGMYQRSGVSIPVAAKTLKQDELPNAAAEIMKEARLMADLQHRNIVRMIGVCKSEAITLVLELAPLGPLNKFLKKKPEFIITKVLELMFQVAEGMAYLESKHFVHRDLAARNVLLVTEQFAKISDFGMSKALGRGNEYYKASAAGKWPLKWYAPECIYFFKFDSKSDVWSYGVTLWEATSYGQKPYRGLRGQEILELIESGQRLERPMKCPPGVYEIMKTCWEFEQKNRPQFTQIVEQLRKYKGTVHLDDVSDSWPGEGLLFIDQLHHEIVRSTDENL